MPDATYAVRVERTPRNTQRSLVAVKSLLSGLGLVDQASVPERAVPLVVQPPQ